MNKHIDLVKKWLADKDSVSLEELKANADAAYADAAASYAAGYVTNVDAAYAADAASYAAHDVAYYIKRYEELTK